MKFLFTEHKMLVIAILVLFIFSLLCQVAAGFFFQNMLKETHNMSSTKNKMLKACKLRFVNRYELHDKVANTPVFVDKFLYDLKWGPLPVKGLQHFSGQLILLSVFLTGVGACFGIIAEETLGQIFSYYILSFVMLYAYFAISAAVDVKGKQEALKTNLIDYLENNVSVRIPQSKKDGERLDALEARADRKEPLQKERVETERKWADITDFASRRKQEEQQRLEPEEMRELRGLLRDLV